MEINGRQIGLDYLTYFVAEIGANHDGDLQRALRLIELAADSGADAVKFQHFTAETLVSRRGFADLNGKLAHQTAWEKDVYEVYREAEIPLEWTEHLSSYAHDHGLAFITTPYSLELADAVEPYVDAYKIGSGDVAYLDLIHHVARKNKPVLVATGAAWWAEAYQAYVAARSADLVMMHCNTDYSTDPDKISHANLRVLSTFRTSFGCEVGLSDHTSDSLVVSVAVALGATVIEKHFTDDPQRKGPDHPFAITPFEWRSMVTDAASVRVALGDGRKKVEENETESRIVQRRALRYVATMPFGDTISKSDVVATRPCPEGALDPNCSVVGRTLKRDVEADALVRIEDFE